MSSPERTLIGKLGGIAHRMGLLVHSGFDGGGDESRQAGELRKELLTLARARRHADPEWFQDIDIRMAVATAETSGYMFFTLSRFVDLLEKRARKPRGSSRERHNRDFHSLCLDMADSCNRLLESISSQKAASDAANSDSALLERLLA